VQMLEDTLFSPCC